jgi:hypothetical protein
VIQSGDQAKTIVFTIRIRFPLSTRIHRFEKEFMKLNHEMKQKITNGLSSGIDGFIVINEKHP